MRPAATNDRVHADMNARSRRTAATWAAGARVDQWSAGDSTAPSELVLRLPLGNGQSLGDKMMSADLFVLVMIFGLIPALSTIFTNNTKISDAAICGWAILSTALLLYAFA